MDYWLNQRKDRYECTRSAWKLNPEIAKKYPYVLSVTGGIVREVYKVTEWHYCESMAYRVNSSRVWMGSVSGIWRKCDCS